MELKPVTMKDAGFLLRLKNQKDVRKFSIVSKGLIKKEDHLKWLEKTLKDKNVQFFIIFDKKPVGDLRIDRGEVSIRISASSQGKGYGRLALKGIRTGKAKIVEGNIKSMNLFMEAGFRFLSYKNGVYLCSK